MSWPTTDDPRTEFVTLRFTVGETADIDWLITQTGARNRSDAVRNAVDRVVAAERRRARKTKKSTTPGGAMLDPENRHGDEQDGTD
jgi:hypothetical protein